MASLSIEEIVSAYGSLIEKYSTAFVDASTLPVPKRELKEALRKVWEKYPEKRSAIEVAYVHLANFQEGVGPEPIEGKLPTDASPEEAIKTLESWSRWSKATKTEVEELLADVKNLGK